MCRKITLQLWLMLVGMPFAFTQSGALFYGTTSEGGRYNNGTIFKTDGNGDNFQIVSEFPANHTGKYPTDAVCKADNGKFYGMTTWGGSYGFGVLFEWDPLTNAYEEMLSFSGIESGKEPNCTLIDAKNGKLYGTTSSGGIFDYGVLFEWDYNLNIFTKKLDFDGVEKGRFPSSLVKTENGKLLGITARGGAFDAGVIYEWDLAAEIFTKRINFNGSEDGLSPCGSFIAANGKIYGMTTQGGNSSDLGYGVLYELDTTTNLFHKIIDFNGENGRYPSGNLVQASNGRLYGITSFGGLYNNGVVFELDPVSNSFSEVFTFGNAENGRNPVGSLLKAENGKLYGITKDGGIYDHGVLFELDPKSKSYFKKLDFAATDKCIPNGTLIQSGNKLYGMSCPVDINYIGGLLFEWDTTTDYYTVKFKFNEKENGSCPMGSLVQARNGKLYGMTQNGGINNEGVIFEFDPYTGMNKKKFDFNREIGRYPRGTLVQANNGRLYGMTYAGGPNPPGIDYGLLFEWDPVTNIFIKEFYFNGEENGRNPYGSLVKARTGNLYGLTSAGGIYSHNDNFGNGVLFQLNPTTNTYSKELDFNETYNGISPCGSLIEATDGKLYGMTNTGGINDHGIIFEWDPNSHVYTKKIDFNGIENGQWPHFNSLFQSMNSNIFGMTREGGKYKMGVLFEWNPEVNILTKKFDFNGTETGQNPQGSLIQGDNGKLYGTTTIGGIYNLGVLFEWDPINNTYTKKYDFNGENGSNPYGSLIAIKCANTEDTTKYFDLNDGLVAYYPFNGTSNDASGNAHTAKVNGAVLTTDRFGEEKSAFLFDGINDNIITDAFFNYGWDEYSVSCWIYSTSWNNPGSNVGNQAIINTIPHNGFELCFNWGGTNKYGVFLNSDPSQPTWDILHNGTSKMGTSINRWNHLVFVKKNNQYSLYINSSLDTSFVSSIPTSNNMCKIVLGSIDPAVENEYYKGKLDDYRIYNRALNNVEITALCTYGDYSLNTPSVLTDPADSISKYTAVVNGIILYDGGAPIVERGVCWSKYSNPDITDNKTLSVAGSDSFVCNITGLNPNTLYYARAYVLNSDAVGYGTEVQFKTLPDLDFGSVNDVDGNVYRTIHIGSYNWMAENLRTTRYSDGSPIPNVTNNQAWGSLTNGAYCWYNNDEGTYKNKNGALYNYYAVIDSRRICPANWHIANNNEWNSIPTTVYIGRFLIPYWDPTALIETGYNPLLNGVRQGLNSNNQPSGAFKFFNFCTLYWQPNGHVFYMSRDYVVSLSEMSFTYSLLNGYSIRCVEDKPVIVFPNLSIFANESFEVPISADHLPEGEAISYQFDFFFDSNRMVYIGTSLDNTLSIDGEVQVNQKEGKLSVAWAGQSALADSGILIKLRFKAIEADTLNPVISNFLLNTDTIEYITNGIISISPAYGDIDGNDAIQAFDAALALQYSVGLDPLPDIDTLPWENYRIAGANVDGEANISAYDASLILQYTVGIINSFPVQGYLKSAIESQADVSVEIENGNIVFRSSGDFKGLNVSIGENAELFGSPDTSIAGALLASNYSSTGISIGMAMANTPPENEIILIIPIIGIPERQVILNLLINNREKQINLGMITEISETFQKTIEIYPNPANKILYFKNLPKNVSISICDLQGRKIIAETIINNQIDISGLTNGVYIINIKADKNTMTKKLIKQ